MAILPPPVQVARAHIAIYENFYKQVDPARRDHVAAGEAASFLKRSELSDTVLSKIWDMSDPQGKGYLDKRGFFVALKLIALSQNGKDLSMANLALDVPPPQIKFDQSGRNSPPTVDWSIKAAEQNKYDQMFSSLGPENGKLPGEKVKPVMLNSKLPMDVLGRIWDLSDTDQDGCLSKAEFILAMHLIYKALENIPVPPVLPPELSAFVRKRSTPSVPILPDLLHSAPDNSSLSRIRRSSTPSSDVAGRTQSWVVSAADKAKYDELFRKLDTDFDGFVTGLDIKDTFLQSGLPQNVLASIWMLCDIKQNGKLNAEQFALAMHFVQQQLQGMELPAALLPEMIPPTLRPKPTIEAQSDISALVITNDPETTGNKELDLIATEIKELQAEKMVLEKDLAQKEADVKIRNGELKNCQNELEALNTMLKQLEMQKGEAGKRLNDLDNQHKSVELSLSEVIETMEDELKQIELLKKQKEEQKVSVEAQEEELQQKKREVAEIKQEEAKLETQISESKSQLDNLTNTLQSTQLQISQIKLKIDQVNEQHRLLSDAIDKMDTSLSSGDTSGIPDFILSGISPLHETDLDNLLPSAVENVPSEVNGPTVVDDFQEDPFKNKDPFNEVNGFAHDPFAEEDPFQSADPFKESRASISDDPFAAPYAFSENFAVTQSNATSDPFQGSDPFGSFSATSTSKPVADPFDPFGLSENSGSKSPVTVPSNADPFGADPFGPSPVAPPRPASPTPALPPKKSKAPPPRPAPPKIGTSSAAKPAPTRAAPAPPVPPAPDPFKIAEAEATKQSQGFTDLFSKGPNKDQDPFDPFSSTAAPQDSFANFDNFADFDSIK